MLLLFAVGLTYAEVAEHVDASRRTVDRLLRRARQRVRAGAADDARCADRDRDVSDTLSSVASGERRADDAHPFAQDASPGRCRPFGLSLAKAPGGAPDCL